MKLASPCALLIASLSFGACGGSEGEMDAGPPLPPRALTQSCLGSMGDEPPAFLSETGCFLSLEPLLPSADLIPYGVSSPLWTDGALKPRYLSVPADSTIGLTGEGQWSFPDNTVLVKMFNLERVLGDPSTEVLVETRFMRFRGGLWTFFSYQWNEDGTDARLLGPDESPRTAFVVDADGEERTVDYAFPRRDSCTTCHSDGAGEPLGPRTDQLNYDYDYGHVRANQLEAMDAIGLFGEPGSVDPDMLSTLPNPADETVPIQDRARAWLHGNCGHCHRPGGWTSPEIGMDLRFSTAFEEQGACGVRRQFFGASLGDYLIDPGAPDNSAILGRMRRTDVARMPPLGVSVLDPLGERVVSEWIGSLTECPDE